MRQVLLPRYRRDLSGIRIDGNILVRRVKACEHTVEFIPDCLGAEQAGVKRFGGLDAAVGGKSGYVVIPFRIVVHVKEIDAVHEQPSVRERGKSGYPAVLPVMQLDGAEQFARR